MSDDQRGSGPFGGRERPDLAGRAADEIEAARLSEVLAAAERAEIPDLDPIEDPMLASLSATAASIRSSLEAASARASFETFHDRSRRHVMAATPQVRLKWASSERGESLLQRWNGLFTSVSSAAAAAVATFVVTVLAIGGGASTEQLASSPATNPPATGAQVANVTGPTAPSKPGVNLTTLSTAEQIEYWRETMARVEALTNDGESVDEPLLRELADVGASVSQRIKDGTDTDGTDAYVAWHAGYDSQQILSQAAVADDAGPALETARSTANEAMVVAARYLTPERMPRADDVAAILDPDSLAAAPAAEDPGEAP